MRNLPHRIKAGSLQCRHRVCSPSMEKISFLALLPQTLQSYGSSEMKLMTQTTFHTQGTCQTVLLWSQPSPVSIRVSQLSVGLTFSCLTFQSEFEMPMLPSPSPSHTQLVSTDGFWREHKRSGRLSSKHRPLPSAPPGFCMDSRGPV